MKVGSFVNVAPNAFGSQERSVILLQTEGDTPFNDVVRLTIDNDPPNFILLRVIAPGTPLVAQGTGIVTALTGTSAVVMMPGGQFINALLSQLTEV